jgi:hypothetical protein
VTELTLLDCTLVNRCHFFGNSCLTLHIYSLCCLHAWWSWRSRIERIWRKYYFFLRPILTCLVLSMISQLMFMFLLLLLAKGWAVSNTAVSDKTYLIVGVCVFLLSYITMFIWQNVGEDPASTVSIYTILYRLPQSYTSTKALQVSSYWSWDPLLYCGSYSAWGRHS